MLIIPEFNSLASNSTRSRQQAGSSDKQPGSDFADILGSAVPSTAVPFKASTTPAPHLDDTAADPGTAAETPAAATEPTWPAQIVQIAQMMPFPESLPVSPRAMMQTNTDPAWQSPMAASQGPGSANQLVGSIAPILADIESLLATSMVRTPVPLSLKPGEAAIATPASTAGNIHHAMAATVHKTALENLFFAPGTTDSQEVSGNADKSATAVQQTLVLPHDSRAAITPYQTTFHLTDSNQPHSRVPGKFLFMDSGWQLTQHHESPAFTSGPSSGIPGVMLAAATSGISNTATEVTAASIASQVGSAQWNYDLGQQIVRMTLRGDQQVSLHLHPSELGPLTLEMRMVEQQAQINLLSAHAQVRTALEQALPQLRDTLAEQGIQLGQTFVGEQHAGQREWRHTAGQLGSDSNADADKLKIEQTCTSWAVPYGGGNGVSLYV